MGKKLAAPHKTKLCEYDLQSQIPFEVPSIDDPSPFIRHSRVFPAGVCTDMFLLLAENPNNALLLLRNHGLPYVTFLVLGAEKQSGTSIRDKITY